MRPSFSAFNSADSVFTNTIFGSNFTLKSGVQSYGGNLLLGQFGGGALLPSIGGSVLCSIPLVILRRIPSKIANVIVPRISVVMAALKAVWTRTNKRSQNKRMWFHDSLFSPIMQIHERPIFFFVKCVGFDFFRLYGTNVPMVRNFINSFKANNRQPLFHKSFRMQHTGMTV